MNKQVIDSILLANSYLICCKLNKVDCPKSDLARKYLISKIKKALLEKKKSNSKKPFFSSIIDYLFR